MFIGVNGSVGVYVCCRGVCVGGGSSGDAGRAN